VGGVGVLAGVAAGPALAQQVPALVELDLDLVEAGLLVLVEAFAAGLALEGVLLFDQGTDTVEDLPVVHGLLRGLGRCSLPAMMPLEPALLHLLVSRARGGCLGSGMRTRSLLLAALVAALLLSVAAVPAGAAGPATPRTWGGNSFGELGDGTTAGRLSAGPVTGLSDATELAGGREHVLALRADGSVWTWGSNQYGQQGDGSTANRPAPGPVAGLAGAVQVAAGHYHSLALLGDGTVRAWGMNSQSQLGDGTTTRRTSPVTVPNLTGVELVAAGRAYSAAL
jgi:Regulator of chromosome condensation (RCC1) repeat